MTVMNKTVANNMKVMVIDDDHDLGEGLRLILQLDGFTVSVCREGREALELAEREHFDLFITDYQMPMLDGVEVTKRLRQRFFETPIIGISCDDVGDLFLEAGADGFLHKPLTAASLRRLLERFLSPARPRRVGRMVTSMEI